MPPARSLASSVADKVIRHARYAKKFDEARIWCKNCKLLPVQPITGRCGHTRCATCVRRFGRCPCGSSATETFSCNILVREILNKMSYRKTSRRSVGVGLSPIIKHPDNVTSTSVALVPSSPGKVQKNVLRSRSLRRQPVLPLQTGQKDMNLRRLETTPQMRYKYASEMLRSGRLQDAAAVLAHVAATDHRIARHARILLAQVIAQLRPSDPRRLMRSLYNSVRLESPTNWIDPISLECPVCYERLNQPVTTTCGHTFCLRCLARTLANRNYCPLCTSRLDDFNLAVTEQTELVCALMGTISHSHSHLDPDYIPVFTCTVAFPSIACPLMISESDFRNVVSRVLDVGLRKFGMLASCEEAYANYGTIVEIRDCILLEDGKAILTTVGVSRFRTLDKVTINGCPYARVEGHVDVLPAGEELVFDLQMLARKVKHRALQWLPSLEKTLLTDISNTFGPFRDLSDEKEWWKNPNGPNWLWWLTAILPLRSEIQMLMLSTKLLSKRLTAVLRTLDAVNAYDYVIASLEYLNF